MPPACYTNIGVTARLGWGGPKGPTQWLPGIPILQCISVVSLATKGLQFTHTANRQDIQTDRTKYPQMMPYLQKDKLREVLTGLTGSSNNHD